MMAITTNSSTRVKPGRKILWINRNIRGLPEKWREETQAMREEVEAKELCPDFTSQIDASLGKLQAKSNDRSPNSPQLTNPPKE
jgi:hypothetical protein